jgi:hypothetical protein
MKLLPLTIEDLINELDTTYPEKCPDLGSSIDQIMFYAGQRNVVRTLKHRLKHTMEKTKLGLETK